MSKTSQVTSSIKVEVQKTDHERVTLHCYIFHATDATANLEALQVPKAG